MTRVFVYLNLHQTRRHGQPIYSVKALDGDFKGRVIARSGYVLIKDAHGKVSQAGRQRVLREQRKSVHAGIVGELVSLYREPRFTGSAITYNPYKYPDFVWKDTEGRFDGSPQVYLDERGVTAA